MRANDLVECIGLTPTDDLDVKLRRFVMTMFLLGACKTIFLLNLETVGLAFATWNQWILLLTVALNVGIVGVAWRWPMRPLPPLSIFSGLVWLWLIFRLPHAANEHFMIAIASLGLCLVWRTELASKQAALLFLQWLGLLIVFNAGVQKMLYGTYDHAEFFSLLFAAGDRFHVAASRWLFSDSDAARLLSYGAQINSGPYRAEGSPWALVASNAVVWLELLLPLTLLTRFRRVAAALLLLFVVGIQLVTKEYFFALQLANLLTLFWWPQIQLGVQVLLVSVGVAAAIFS